MPCEALEPVLAPLDNVSVATTDADHADHRDGRRDQVYRPALPGGARRVFGQHDVNALTLRKNQPHDELDLSGQVVQSVRDNHDDLVIVDHAARMSSISDSARRGILGFHREAVLLEPLQRVARLEPAPGVLHCSRRFADG